MFTAGELHCRTTTPSWGRKKPGKQPSYSSYATEMLSIWSDATDYDFILPSFSWVVKVSHRFFRVSWMASASVVT
jgi:hypothetical protein